MASKPHRERTELDDLALRKIGGDRSAEADDVKDAPGGEETPP